MVCPRLPQFPVTSFENNKKWTHIEWCCRYNHNYTIVNILGFLVLTEVVLLGGVGYPPTIYSPGASCKMKKEKEKVFPPPQLKAKYCSVSTGEAALSRGAGKGAGAWTSPGGSGGREQDGVFGDTSGARDSTQESSGHSSFPAAGQPASDPTKWITVPACHAQGFLSTPQRMLSVTDAGFWQPGLSLEQTHPAMVCFSCTFIYSSGLIYQFLNTLCVLYMF